MPQNYLSVTWSISRGRETYGYNICRLDDYNTGKRFRCLGGGYDMTGTVFGDWLEDVYADRLLKLKDRAHQRYSAGHERERNDAADALHGMTYTERTDRVHVDGGCGLESMRRIAEVIGLDVRAVANRRGHVVGFTVDEASPVTA